MKKIGNWKTYADYLASPQWAEKRRLVMVRCLGRCEIIGCKNKADDCHHWTYDRIGCEDLDDLAGICRAHHRQLHAHKQKRRVIGFSNHVMPVNKQLDLFASAANDNNRAVVVAQVSPAK